MKTKIVLTTSIAVLLAAVALAGEKPVNTTPLNKETIAEAKASGKMILTGSSSFGDRHISGFLERNFVVQPETTEEGTAFLSVYDSNGRLVHRVANDPIYPYELAVKIKRGLDSETQYYPLLRRFEAGERSVSLLQNAIIGADDTNDETNAPRLMQVYVNQLPDVPTESELAFVARYTKHTSDPGFTYLMEREVHLNKLADIIFEDVFLLQVSNKHLDTDMWLASVKARYPESLAPAMDRMMVELLERRNDQAGLNAFVLGFIQRSGEGLNAAQIAYYTGLMSE